MYIDRIISLATGHITNESVYYTYSLVFIHFRHCVFCWLLCFFKEGKEKKVEEGKKEKRFLLLNL